MQEAREIVMVDISLVDDSPFNPRLDYDAPDMVQQVKNLGQQIKVEAETNFPGMDYGYGVKQAPVARQMPDGRYQQAFGHTRKRAVKAIGGTLFPLVIEELADDDMERLGFAENIQQKGMTHSEKARKYLSMAVKHGWARSKAPGAMPEEWSRFASSDAPKADTSDNQETINEIAIGKVAKEIGRPAKEVRDYITMMAFPPMMLKLFDMPVRDGGISFGLVDKLGQLPRDLRAKIINALTSQKLKVADAEATIDAAIKDARDKAFREAQGIPLEPARMFDVAAIPRSSRFAKALYTEDMARVAAVLGTYGDAEGAKLAEAMPAMDLNLERDRLKAIIATLLRMDKAMQEKQAQQRKDAIVGK